MMGGSAWGLVLLLSALPVMSQPGLAARTPGPVELRADDLVTPLGIDDAAPRFSWQLQDQTRGAKQTAYQVEVASNAELLRQDKADVWDSGKVESAASLNVSYAGPALKASTRYFWQVKVWDAAGKLYLTSATSWWETGLLTQDAWKSAWIGYETAEEAAVRHARAAWITSADAKELGEVKAAEQRVAYRKTVTLEKPVRSAALYAAGQDTVAAWVNGVEVLAAQPFPAWKQMPWKKFVRADVTDKLSTGANTIAIETVHYGVDPNAPADTTPMIATLVVEYADGTVASFGSGADCKAAAQTAAGWQQKGFDDSGWVSAVEWKQAPGPMNGPLGHPWIPDSV